MKLSWVIPVNVWLSKNKHGKMCIRDSSNDEADEAAALASARDAVASLDSREKIVDRIAQGINARYVKMFGFSADDAGIDSKELARWFIAVSYTHLDVYKRQVFERGFP